MATKPFLIPEQAMPLFQRLVEKENLAVNVFGWATFMCAFNTMHTWEHGVELFSTPSDLRTISTSADDILVAIDWRTRLLGDFFQHGVYVPGPHPGFQLAVTVKEDIYVIREEVVGRWGSHDCWIDQRTQTTVPIDRPFKLLETIVKRLKELH